MSARLKKREKMAGSREAEKEATFQLEKSPKHSSKQSPKQSPRLSPKLSPKQSSKLPDAAMANSRSDDAIPDRVSTPPNSPVLVVNGAVLIPTEETGLLPAVDVKRMTRKEKKRAKKVAQASRSDSQKERSNIAVPEENTVESGGQKKLTPKRKKESSNKAALEETAPENDGQKKLASKHKNKASKAAPEEITLAKDGQQRPKPKQKKLQKNKVLRSTQDAAIADEQSSVVDGECAKLTLKEKKRLKKAALKSTREAAAESCPSGGATEKKKKRKHVADAEGDHDKEKRKAAKSDKLSSAKSSGDRPKKPVETSGTPSPEESDPNRYKVFVGGISFSVDEEEFREHFEMCGSIRSLNFQKDDKGRPKGVAFITFESEEAVNTALACDGFELDGRALTVEKAKSRDKSQGVIAKKAAGGRSKGKSEVSAPNEPDQNDLKVFVGGIPFSADENLIRCFFEACGCIASFNLQMDENGNSRGFAFIRFETKEAVSNALEYDGADFKGRKLTVNMASQRRPSSKNAKGDSKGDKQDGKGKAKGKGKNAKKGKGKGKSKWKGK